MKVKERGAWVSNNVGKGGKRPSYDEFNKSFKGQERNPKAEEYASKGIEEYHHYDERQDVTNIEELSEKKNNAESKSKNKRSSKTNLLKNIVGRVVAAVACAVVVVSSYVTMTVVSSKNWIWSSDLQTVTVELLRRDGGVLRELPATITITQQDPTCNQTGLKTYTATAEDEDGTIYTDEHKEVLSALGHDHHIVSESSENGQIIRTYKCSRCDEEFTVTIDIDEND